MAEFTDNTTVAPVWVGPDGPKGTHWVVCGEAPAREEVRMGRGFVGPSGKMLWPLLWKLAGLRREEVWVTNLCKHPLDDDAAVKLDDEEFAECTDRLMEELREVRHEAGQDLRVLAVGAYAARALLGDQYTTMDVVSGMTFPHPLGSVTPVFHPAAALRGAGEKDPLAWIGDGLAHFRHPRVATAVIPPLPAMWDEAAEICEDAVWGVDTEGTPEDPICMTIACHHTRLLVWPHQAAQVYDLLRGKTVVMHNGLWDWGVLEAMGVSRPWDVSRFRDSMQLAYLKQTEPKGLKELGYRWFGLRMKGFEELVRPYWEAMAVAAAQGIVEAGTTTITHSAKTGKLLKKPKLVVGDAVKPLKRALHNPKLLVERMPGFPPMTLRCVPVAELVEYATLDAWVTREIYKVLTRGEE